jgi:THAP4-like, heme-binding beta-barrel domain
MELHKALEPLAWLLGTWRGEGKGIYPTIDDFDYAEESRFWHNGRPVMAYAQRTWSPATDAPMHSEMGFLRPQRDGSIEIVVTHSFGVVEMGTGTISDGLIEVQSTSFTSTPTAKRVEGLIRRYSHEGDALVYEIDMAFGAEALQNHLRATLRRTSEPS